MNATNIARVLALIGTIAGLAITQQGLVSTKAAPFIALVAAACTASAGVFKKFSGGWGVTLVGGGVAVFGAITPVLANMQDTWAHTALRWATFAGIALAAVGKGIFGFDPSEPAKQDDGQTS